MPREHFGKKRQSILHELHHYPETKALKRGYSRHFYDFYQLLNSKFKEEALDKLELLDEVANHKKVFFRRGWAKFDLAKKGTLKLIPKQRILNELKKDYSEMEVMFFNTFPSWDDILKTITEFERSFNS